MEQYAKEVTAARLRVGQIVGSQLWKHSLEGLGQEEREATQARLQAFFVRLNTDPGFYRHVWSRIVRDRSIRKHVGVIYDIIAKEAEGKPPSRAEISKRRLGPGDARADATSDPAFKSDSTVFRVVYHYYPELFQPGVDSADARRTPLGTAFGPTPSEAIVGLQEPLRQRFVENAETFDRAMRPYHDLLQVFPEGIEWSTRTYAVWNRAMGRSEAESLYKWPASEKELRVLDVATVIVTSQSIPTYWFLRRTSSLQAMLLSRATPLRFGESDIAQLGLLWDRLGMREAYRLSIVEDAAWALLQYGHPNFAGVLASAATMGRFGESPHWARLYHPLAVSWVDQGFPKKALGAAIRLRDYGAKHHAGEFEFIGHLLWFGIPAELHVVGEVELLDRARQATAAAERLGGPRAKAWGLTNLAFEMHKAGLVTEAFRTIDQAGEFAQQSSDLSAQDYVSRTLILMVANGGKSPMARSQRQPVGRTNRSRAERR